MPELDMLQDGSATSAGAALVEQLNTDWLLLRASDAVMLPGGAARLLDAARAAPEATLIVGTAIPVGADDSADRERVRAHTMRHQARVARFADAAYLAVYGYEDVAAVVCRCTRMTDEELAVLASVGLAAVLDGRSAEACMVLADPVCARLGPASKSEAGQARGLRAAGSACRRLWVHARGRRTGVRSLFSMTHAALGAALGLEGARARIRTAYESAWRWFVWRTLVPLGEHVYDFILGYFSEWPIGREVGEAGSAGGPRKVAYYIWRFPVLSETFIQRELGALDGAGVEVTVIADAPGSGVHADAELEPLTRRTRYVLPLAPITVLRDLITSLLRRPLRTLNLFVYTVARPYNAPKTFSQDVRVFLKAVHVGSMLRAMKATHLHAPWGETNAFIGMIAARLAGADFSLQFRAQDLHRRTLAFLISEKVHNARFVITNTRYNLEHLRALVRPGDRAKIRQIYNGLELERLTPGPRSRDCDVRPVRILSVARLIEQKGLPYLFEACRLLLDRGRDLRCSVVGGPELPLYVNDLIEIRRRRRALGLEEVVELAGAQPFARVIDAYRSADIFVLPCVVGGDASTDIIPNVILEAMAMGVPVVATSTTAVPELIEDGETGLLVPPNDAVALADAIDRLIMDSGLRTRLASGARVRVEDCFDISKNVAAYAELFCAP